MDRTAELWEALGAPPPPAAPPGEERFYVALNTRICGTEARVARAMTYRAVLGLEEQAAALDQEITALLGAVEVEGSSDQQAHFAGIKQILAQRLARLRRLLQEKKRSMAAADDEIAPERPATFRAVESNQRMEQETQRIVRNTDYELARQRLHKIESVQKVITENLTPQDERIDSICSTTGETTRVYQALDEEGDFGGGSLQRRAFFVILLCFSFVLLFLNWFHK